MGVLDELKKEAEQVKAAKDQEMSSSMHRIEEIQKALLPKMNKLYRYFKDMKEQLEVVQPDLSREYVVRGYGPVGGLKQGNYRLFTDDVDQIRKFTFGYAYATEGSFEFKEPAASKVGPQKEYMWGANLRFATRDAADGSTTFIVENHVPVSFEFEAEFEKAAIRLRVKNLEALGASVHMLSPDRIDKEFTEELAKIVLHKENRFNELTGNALSETTRMKLRTQIEEAKRRKEAELAGKVPAAGKKVVVKKKVKRKEKPSLTEKFSRTFFGKK